MGFAASPLQEIYCGRSDGCVDPPTASSSVEGGPGADRSEVGGRENTQRADHVCKAAAFQRFEGEHRNRSFGSDGF